MVRVYAVTCLPSGKAYIGCSAAKLGKRFNEHKCLAKSGRHHAKALIAEWAKFGDDNFIVSVLQDLGETPTLIEKREAELKWLKTYADKGLLLNDDVLASFRPTELAKTKGRLESAKMRTGKPQTPESNAKRRIAQLGKPKGHGAKISATKRANWLKRTMI